MSMVGHVLSNDSLPLIWMRAIVLCGKRVDLQKPSCDFSLNGYIQAIDKGRMHWLRAGQNSTCTAIITMGGCR